MEYKDRQTDVNYEECLDYVRRSSNPSKLRITDVKFTKVDLRRFPLYSITGRRIFSFRRRKS